MGIWDTESGDKMVNIRERREASGEDPGDFPASSSNPIADAPLI
jgi:hypothetical protein